MLPGGHITHARTLFRLSSTKITPLFSRLKLQKDHLSTNKAAAASIDMCVCVTLV